MDQRTGASSVKASAVVTVAYLKAQLDSGSDHLGIFSPLVIDVVSQLPRDDFSAQDVQEAIAATHGISIPQQTVTTLLKRATNDGLVRRDEGRYWKTEKTPTAESHVTEQKAAIVDSQSRLADALHVHADRRGLTFQSQDEALEALLRFLEVEQVGLLLQAPSQRPRESSQASKEHSVVAEFIQDVVAPDAALATVLSRILEGLVLYHAAFLPNLSEASKRFANLSVVFDSVLVRQALGYEGSAAHRLMRDTFDVLRAAGIACIVFDQSVQEIRRILAMYETKLASEGGRRSLHPVPMARHFLSRRYSPGDVREMSALLDQEIASAGFRVVRTPKRVAQFTSGESALAKRLADPNRHDELEPRVVHDVDCIAGVLTLRQGHRSNSLEDAAAVFATSSPLVILNVKRWWNEDEHENSIEPAVHIRALANLAWLKKPKLSAEYKLRELVALCAAALRPRQSTWDRFLRHLDALQKANRITSDESAAVVVSAMSDRLLREAERDVDDPGDLDAVTLDEIVERVRQSYAARAKEELGALESDLGRKVEDAAERERAAIERANAAEQSSAELIRRHMLAVNRLAQSWARAGRWIAQGAVVGAVLIGAAALILGHQTPAGYLGKAIGVGIAVFVVLELVGILKHVRELGQWIEAKLLSALRSRLDGSAEARSPWER